MKVFTLNAWKRYLARIFDFRTFTYLSASVFLLLDAIGVPLQEVLDSLPPLGRGAIALTFLILGFACYEASCTSLFGSTPGKLWFRLQIRNHDDRRPAWTTTFCRSIDVWARGLGLSIPLMSLLVSFFAARELAESGSTMWDDRWKTRVREHPIGEWRLTAAICVTAGIWIFDAVDRLLSYGK